MKPEVKRMKGIITFPCCPKEKMIVFQGTTRGEVSIRCPRCGQYVCFNFEEMEGELFHSLKGATTR